MKTPIKFRFVAMVSLLMAAVLFTDKLTAQTFHVKPPSKPFTESAIYQLASNSFSFDILVSSCFAGGTSLIVSIANPEKYAFLWE
jgi:hypothetical protein